MRGVRFVRVGLATTMLAGMVVLMPGRASATVTGSCTATLAGVPLTSGHDSVGTAIDVDYRALIQYDGKSTTGERVGNVRVHLEVLGLDVRSFDGHSNGPGWTSRVEIKKYAWAGVGLYHVRGVAFGASGTLCSGVAYMCVKGKTPLETVAGILGVLLGAVALYLLAKGLVVRKRRSRAELATRFGATGVLGGVSAIILLQQFCIFPLTQSVAGGAVGGGLLGMALVGALIAGAPGKTMPVVIPPKGREEPELLYRFAPPDDACNACKKHAAHRTYRSEAAADADRAHPGCHCEVVSRPSQRVEVVAHFPGNRTVYDDRET